jgi:hypothetical protein
MPTSAISYGMKFAGLIRNCLQPVAGRFYLTCYLIGIIDVNVVWVVNAVEVVILEKALGLNTRSNAIKISLTWLNFEFELNSTQQHTISRKKSPFHRIKACLGGMIFEKPFTRQFTKSFSDYCNAAKISVFCGTIKVSLRSFILVCIAYLMARIVPLNLWSRRK